jgi:predicted esterase
MERSVSRLVVLFGLLGMLGCGSSDGGAPDGGAPAAPSIDTFTATPSAIQSGASSTLAWTVRNATSVALNGASVTGTSSVVSPTATTSYTLTASNSAGTATATATVTVSAASSIPPNPIPFTKGTVFTLDSGTTNWVMVPEAYDSTHQTPISLFVWLHGCGGESSGDIYDVSPGTGQTWISLTVGGREDDCWDPNSDSPKVLAAIANLKTHFNIDPKRVVLGGYSSGGDLGYRLAFYDALDFAGILAENTSPFRDTGSSAAQSIAAAGWKFRVAHLAHLEDETYPIAGVREELAQLTAAGFPVTAIEREGTHYDNPGAVVNGNPVPGTVADLQSLLLPFLSAGWTAP